MPDRRPGRASSAAALLVLLACLGIVAVPATAQDGDRDEVEAPETPVTWSDTEPATWPSPPPASARAYVLQDADTGQVLATRSPDDPRVVASTVKLLTILTALEVLDTEDEVVVSEEAAVGGASTGVDPGETWRVGDLVDAILVRSGNDAARALAAAAGDDDIEAFVEDMRDTATDLGLVDVVLTEPTGLDDENELSARALATIARTALADPRIPGSAGHDVVELPGSGPQPNRNLLVGTYEGATGLKTGYTDLAGYCLVASAERDGRDLVAIVLGAREDPARFEEAAALLDHAFEDLASVPYDALEARQPAGWAQLLPDGRTWAARADDVALDLRGTVEDLELRFTADDVTLGTTRVEVPEGTDEGTGAVLVDALYRSMRRAHVAGLWPDGASPGTGRGGSG